MSKRYINIKTLKHGETTYDTIQSVTVDQRAKRISDSGDNDKHVSFQARGVADTSIRVELRDPVQAKALQGNAKQTMEFIGVPESGGTEVKVTVTNVEFYSHSLGGRHNDLHTQTIDGGAMSSDGATDPVTIAPAS